MNNAGQDVVATTEPIIAGRYSMYVTSKRFKQFKK